MWQQFLFWALAGPKHLRRFLLLWLVLMGVVFYAFVHEGFDSSPDPAGPPRPPAASPAGR